MLQISSLFDFFRSGGLKQFLGDFLFPRFCVCCKSKVGRGYFDFICPLCIVKLSDAYTFSCKRCGSFLPRGLEELCKVCQELNPIFRNTQSLFLMKGTGKHLIHTLKYKKGLFILKDISRLLSQKSNLLNFLSNCVLVPVPLYSLKHVKRGFNQSYHICKLIQKMAKNVDIQPLLKRTKYTQSQTHLSLQQRKKNVTKAFDLYRNMSINASLRYLIIDDVFTTGHTVNACADVLQRAGVKHIDVFTLGHG